MKNAIQLLVLSILLAACQSGNGSDEQQDRPTDAATQDQLIMQLSTYLIADPQDQAGKDQNAIVNYAIDKLIPLERTRSGLLYRVLEPGDGELLQWADYISVHYKGYFLDSQVFDDTRRRNKPLQFYIGNMIPGWNEGLQLIAPGGRIQLFVPSPLGYGTEGMADRKGGFLVPPDTPLIFEVEVLEKLDPPQKK